MGWQCLFSGALFGFVNDDGIRRYREALLFVGRKNAKSTLGAAILLFMLLTEDEPGFEAYSAAATREQAALVYEIAAGMIRQNSELSKIINCHPSFKQLVYQPRGKPKRFYRALAAEAGSQHGLSASAVFCDEIHAMKDAELMDVLRTSQGARKNPLFFSITTSDYERPSECNRLVAEAMRIRDDPTISPRFLPALYFAGRDEDWTSEATWRKANPGLGETVSVEFLREECERALREPSYESTFRRLYLNQSTSTSEVWLPLHKWDACRVNVPEPPPGLECYGGLDLSITGDLTAFVLLFPNYPEPGRIYALPYFFAPRERARLREKEDHVPYLSWADRGLLNLNEGDAVDFEEVRACIQNSADRWQVLACGYDPFLAQQLAIELRKEGVNMIEVSTRPAVQTVPIQSMEKAVISCELAHGGHEVYRWNVANVQLARSQDDLLKLDKSRRRGRIDAVAATVSAFAVMVGNGKGKAAVPAEVANKIQLMVF